MVTLFGLLPSMIKMASMAGEAQLGTQVLLVAAGVAIGAPPPIASDKYKQAIEKPHEAEHYCSYVLRWYHNSIPWPCLACLFTRESGASTAVLL